MVEKPGKRVEPLLPELARVIEPIGRPLHRLGRQGAAHHPARFLTLDEPGVLEDLQVLRETGQGHREGARELGDWTAAGGEQPHHLPARRVGERGEDRVEGLV